MNISQPKVALYLRLSQEDIDKLTKEQMSESIKNQEMMLRNYAKNENWQIVGIYNDEDYSGADSMRPAFNKMIIDCESGKIDVVLCKTQARFARDSEIIEKYLHNKFHEWNIRFQTVVDKIDNTKRETKKTSQILGLTDEWMLEDTSINIRETLKIKRKAGEFTGSFAKYGLLKDPENKNHLLPDPLTKDIVIRIYDEYMQGYGLKKIANNLNKDKILSPFEYKKLNGCKLHIPLLKEYLDYDFIETAGTYVINVSFINNHNQILHDLITFNYLTSNMKNFNNKCTITLKRYLQNKTKIYYSTKNNLKINKFNEKDFVLLKENDTLPNNITCIATYTKELDRTHTINYQFEINLKDNKNHEKLYFITQSYNDNKNIKINFETNIRKKLMWSEQTIKGILTDEIYIGNLVQFKTTTVNYKNHTIIKNNEKNRIRKNNTHKPIIEPEIWHKVQERLKEKTRSCKTGTIHIFNQKIFCANCGKVFKKCGKTNKNGYGYFCCKDKDNKWINCNNNKYLREEDLHNLVLEKFNKILTKYYDEKQIKNLNNISIEQDLKNKLYILEKKLNVLNKELQNKSLYFSQLYEDRYSGIIPEKDFLILTNKYKDDTTKIEDRISIIKKDIALTKTQKEKLINKKYISKKYSSISKLDTELINCFIDKILIGTYNEKTKSRDIKIIWDFLNN